MTENEKHIIVEILNTIEHLKKDFTIENENYIIFDC